MSPTVTSQEITITYQEAMAKYPAATQDALQQIRNSRSINRNDPPESFVWELSYGRIRGAGTSSSGIMEPLYRITVSKKKIGRCSGLYDDRTQQVIPGNWSF